MTNPQLINLVKSGNTATFLFYQMGIAYYSIYSEENKCYFKFPIDLDSLENTRINRTEKAITILKYIRIANENGLLTKSI